MTADVKAHLKRELKRRCRTNPRYSLRAFADSLRISSAFLSEVLSGKHNVSETMLLRIGERLKLNEEELKQAQESLKDLRRKNRLKRQPKRQVQY